MKGLRECNEQRMVIHGLNDRCRSGVGSKGGVCDLLRGSRRMVVVDIKDGDTSRGEERREAEVVTGVWR